MSLEKKKLSLDQNNEITLYCFYASNYFIRKKLFETFTNAALKMVSHQKNDH